MAAGGDLLALDGAPFEPEDPRGTVDPVEPVLTLHRQPDVLEDADAELIVLRRPAREHPLLDRLADGLYAVHSSAPKAPVALLDAGLGLAIGLALDAGLGQVLTAVVSLLLAGLVTGLYADRDTVSTQGVLWYPSRLLSAAGLAGVFVFAAALGGRPDSWRLVLAAAAVLVVLRAGTWVVLVTLRRLGYSRTPTLVVGPAAKAAAVARRLDEFPEAGLRVHRVICPVGGIEDVDLVRAVTAERVGHVILVPDAAEALSLATWRRCAGIPVRFSMVPPLAELFLQPAGPAEVGGLPLIPLGRLMQGRPRFPGKRVVDVLLASGLLVLAAPILLAAAIAIKLDDGGPVLFRQSRVGRDGRLFGMVKLRTMHVDADHLRGQLQGGNVTDGLLFKLAFDPRVTNAGRLLRRFSVDELPQLWNVLRGDMSLVGPRPLPVPPDSFGPLDGQRHVARPGITGYWQISGGNGLSYDEMIKLDLAYIQNWSPWLDLRLILRTIPALLYRHGPA